MYNINDLKIRCINREDNRDIAKVFLEEFNNKVKTYMYHKNVRMILYRFWNFEKLFKECYFIAEIDNEILELMLVR